MGRQIEIDTGCRGGVTSDERAQMKEMEREIRELRRANEASAKQQRFSPRRSSTVDLSAEQAQAGRRDDAVHR